MRRLKIAQIVSMAERVPPEKYGGSELVAYNLTQSLVKRGHRVTLFACGGSQSSAKLVSVCSCPLRRVSRSIQSAYKLFLIDKLLKMERQFDIIHNHSSWLMLPFVSKMKARFVTTLHGPLNTPHAKLILSHFRKLNYISISYSQRKHLKNIHYVSNVYNGIKIGKFEFNPKPKDYLLFLGRISPEKGVEKAIKIAKLAKKKLIIAAKIDPVDQEYWQRKIKPKIDGRKVVYVGEVSHNRKVRLLKNAQALINPISWPEPFGLVMIEAMACGTPIIAPKRASVPEIVVDKKTGFVVNPRNIIKESIEAVKKIGQIDRRECRKHVEKNFTVEKMVDGYEKVYYKVLNEKT